MLNAFVKGFDPCQAVWSRKSSLKRLRKFSTLSQTTISRHFKTARVCYCGRQLRQAWQLPDLTLSQTSPGFYVSAVQVFWKHCEKTRNCSLWAISPFLTVFSNQLKNFIPFSSNLKLSSANSFNLEGVQNFLFGKGLNTVPNHCVGENFL